MKPTFIETSFNSIIKPWWLGQTWFILIEQFIIPNILRQHIFLFVIAGNYYIVSQKTEPAAIPERLIHSIKWCVMMRWSRLCHLRPHRNMIVLICNKHISLHSSQIKHTHSPFSRGDAYVACDRLHRHAFYDTEEPFTDPQTNDIDICRLLV